MVSPQTLANENGREKVWECAWTLGDAYWGFLRVINKDNDMLFKTMDQTRYMTWWMIGNKFQKLIKMCENMASLISRASRITSDDCRLGGLIHSHRACSMCDVYGIEDINHMLMQCPVFGNFRYQMP